MSQKRYDQWAQIKSGGSIASPRETIAHSIPARSSPELVNATSNTWGPSTCLSHVDVSGVLADASVCSHFGIVGGVRQESRVYYRYISRETFSQVFIYLTRSPQHVFAHTWPRQALRKGKYKLAWVFWPDADRGLENWTALPAGDIKSSLPLTMFQFIPQGLVNKPNDTGARFNRSYALP